MAAALLVLLGFACVVALAVAVVVLRSKHAPALPALPALPDGPNPPTTSRAPSGPLPAMPAWAEKDTSDSRAPMYARNKKLVADANAAGTQYDLVMYGDSITERLASQHGAEWAAFTRGWKAAALGVGGNTVEELTWRLAGGDEVFRKSPRVVVVLIGINDLHKVNAVNMDHLEFCLNYIRRAMPSSKVLLLNVLPDDRSSVTAANAKYKALAQKLGIAFSTCGSSMNPRDKTLFSDGTHPAAGGYRALFACLRPVVERLM